MGSIQIINQDNLLFQPIKLGNIELKHRIALAPLTRFRATKKGHVPIDDLVVEHYRQRSSTPGTFLVTEATFIAAKAAGFDNVPGIWNKEQIEAWKKVGITYSIKRLN
jgi:NADPH2 dehydrogenase